MIRRPSVGERLVLSDTWLLELFLGIYTVTWGAWFLNPFTDTFGASSTAYLILRQFPGGEAAFGAMMVGLGIWKLVALSRWSTRARSIACAVIGIVWIAVGVAVGIPTHWLASQIPAFALLAFANWYCWARLSYRGRV